MEYLGEEIPFQGHEEQSGRPSIMDLQTVINNEVVPQQVDPENMEHQHSDQTFNAHLVDFVNLQTTGLEEALETSPAAENKSQKDSGKKGDTTKAENKISNSEKKKEKKQRRNQSGRTERRDHALSSTTKVEWKGLIKAVYKGFIRDGELYEVGSYVYLTPPLPDQSKYIGQIVELYETGDRQPIAVVQWFFRSSDTILLKEGDSGECDPKELFASEIRDINSIESIEGKCYVRHFDKIVDMESFQSKPDHFFYRYWYSQGTNEWFDGPPSSNSRKVPRSKFVVKDLKKLRRRGKLKSSETGSPTPEAPPTKRMRLQDEGIQFLGSPYFSNSTQSFYRSCQVDGVVYSEGDCAFLRPVSSKELPYICKILFMFETNKQEKLLGVQWFFRPSDLKVTNYSAEPNELFLSGDCDFNPVSALDGKCVVEQLASDSPIPSETNPNYLWFKKWYDSQENKLIDTPLTPSLLEYHLSTTKKTKGVLDVRLLDEYTKLLQTVEDKLIVVYFWSWVTAYEQATVFLEDVCRNKPILLLKVDGDAMDIVRHEGVTAVPHFLFFKSGTKVEEISGLNSFEALKAQVPPVIDKLLLSFSK